jgi:hypothetical protein
VLAYRYGDASVLAPFSYSQLLWVSILGFFIFGEVPSIWTVVGAAFIVASGLYIAHRERVRRASSWCWKSVPERLTQVRASRVVLSTAPTTIREEPDARCDLQER